MQIASNRKCNVYLPANVIASIVLILVLFDPTRLMMPIRVLLGAARPGCRLWSRAELSCGDDPPKKRKRPGSSSFDAKE
jgi:hypothetical protein